jgi:hypothetical protein
MSRPFEVEFDYLRDHLDEMVSATFADLQSQFLVLPKGDSFVEYGEFQDAYEVLKRETSGFEAFDPDRIWTALQADGLTLLVLRTILGMTPPEWADLAQTETEVDVPQGFARTLDARCRSDRTYVARLASRGPSKSLGRIDALVAVASQTIIQGAPPGTADTVHRLAKIDTSEGLTSVQHAASHDVPYAVLLYERYLGRPFASHRDSVSELVGDVMESAIEERLHRAGISYRKTIRAERVPGYDQAPDFFVPDELNPASLIEAKITGDDGTARDKATRIVHLAELRDKRVREGRPSFELIACVDGRGFGVRREDMRRILLNTRGKVFTLATLDHLIDQTRLREFRPTPS